MASRTQLSDLAADDAEWDIRHPQSDGSIVSWRSLGDIRGLYRL